MKERIKNLSGIELGLGPDGEYYLFFTSLTLDQGTRLRLQGSTPQTTERKVLDAWIEEQLNNRTAR
jgi:hypothetical protein